MRIATVTTVSSPSRTIASCTLVMRRTTIECAEFAWPSSAAVRPGSYCTISTMVPTDTSGAVATESRRVVAAGSGVIDSAAASSAASSSRSTVVLVTAVLLAWSARKLVGP